MIKPTEVNLKGLEDDMSEQINKTGCLILTKTFIADMVNDYNKKVEKFKEDKQRWRNRKESYEYWRGWNNGIEQAKTILINKVKGR